MSDRPEDEEPIPDELQQEIDKLNEGAKEGVQGPARLFTDLNYLNEHMAREFQRWEKAQLSTRMMQADTFILEQQIGAVVGFLAHKGIIDMEELHLFYGSKLLEELQRTRAMLERQRHEALRDQARNEILQGVTLAPDPAAQEMMRRSAPWRNGG